MQEIVVRYESTADFFMASIDMRRLKFANGRAATRVKAQEQHALQWFVRGSPGSRYTLEITKPRAARFVHTAILDREMKDAGVHWFSVDNGG
jgi:hypothetical protein